MGVNAEEAMINVLEKIVIFVIITLAIVGIIFLFYKSKEYILEREQQNLIEQQDDIEWKIEHGEGLLNTEVEDLHDSEIVDFWEGKL